MTVAVWPSDLPKPLRAGYSAERQDTRLRRAAGGPVGFRRRFSSASRLVTLSIEVSRARKAVFDDFYDSVTTQGSLPFWMDDPTAVNAVLLDDSYGAILMDDGTPLLLSSQWLCLFGETVPVERIIAGRYEISFTVAVMP